MACPISPLRSSIESIKAAGPRDKAKLVEEGLQEIGVRTRSRAEQVHPLAVDHTIGTAQNVDAKHDAGTQVSNFVSVSSQVDHNDRDSEPRCDVPVASLQPLRDNALPSTPLNKPILIAEEQQQALTTTLTRALASVDALRVEMRSDATRARELGDQARINAESARMQARRARIEAERAAVVRREIVQRAASVRNARASVAAVGMRERVKLRTAPKRAKPTKKARTTSMQTSLVLAGASPNPDDNGGIIALQRRQHGVPTKMDGAAETANTASSATADASIQTDNTKCVFLVLPASDQLPAGFNRGQQTSPVRERQRNGVVETIHQNNCEIPERNEGAPVDLSIEDQHAVGASGESEEALVQSARMPVLRHVGSQCEAATPLVTTGDAATQSDATIFVSALRREKSSEPIPTVPSEDADRAHDLHSAQDVDPMKPSLESAIFAHLITKKVREWLSV